MTRAQESVASLRKRAVAHIREHADDFLPFLTNDAGDMMDAEQFATYCTEMETKAVWGGQCEVRSLSPIHDHGSIAADPRLVLHPPSPHYCIPGKLSPAGSFVSPARYVLMPPDHW